MDKKTFAVMGATGHVGHVIVEELLRRGHRVRAIGRNQKMLQQLHKKGANLIICEFDDLEMLCEAFKDCYAIFSFIPPFLSKDDFSAFQAGVSDAIAQALKSCDIKRVVNLSSLGADFASEGTPIFNLHNHEKQLDCLTNLTTLIHLRAGYFMENLDAFVPVILEKQLLSSPIGPNINIPMVASRDIGWKIADFLDSTIDFQRLIFEFVGPKEVTMQQVAATFGQLLEMDKVRYQQCSFEAAAEMLIANGMREEHANALLAIYRDLNAGILQPQRPLKATHRGATTLEMYLQHLAHKFTAQRSH